MNRKTIDIVALIAGLTIMLLGLYLLYFGSEAGTATASETGANDTFKYIVMAIGFVSVLPWAASRFDDYDKKQLQAAVQVKAKPIVTENDTTSLVIPLLAVLIGVFLICLPYVYYLLQGPEKAEDTAVGLMIVYYWIAFVPLGGVLSVAGLLIAIKRIIQRNVKK